MTVGAAHAGTARLERARTEAWWMYPALPLLAAAIAFAWTVHGELQRMYGMTSAAWDLAYDQQVVWSITQGQGFYSSFARANFLGIHFELILAAIAAVERFWPSPTVLLIFSSAGLAATAPAGYVFFRALLPADRAETPWVAVALSAPLPFWVAVQEPARDFFHPENMALAFALLAGWAGLRGHRIAMWALCVLTLTCKEDQVYTIGVLALLMRGYGAPAVKRQWRFILYLAGAWFLVGTGIIQQQIRSGGYSDVAYYRWLVGLDPSRPVSAGAVLAAIVRPEAVLMAGTVVASLFALPLLAPRWLLLAIPPYLADVLSGHVPQNTLNLHYVLLLLFPLIVAGGVGARRFVETRSVGPAMTAGIMLPALVLGWGAGHFPPALAAGSEAGAYSWPNTVGDLMTATSMIPADAPVNADAGLAVWLANRHTINDFPDKLDATCYVVIDRQAYLSGPTHPAERLAALRALPSSGRRLLYDDGRFQVWSPIGD